MKRFLFLALFALSFSVQAQVSSQSVFYHDYANRPLSCTWIADNNSTQQIPLRQDLNWLLKPGQEYQFEISGLAEGDLVTFDQRNPTTSEITKHLEYRYSESEIRTIRTYTAVKRTDVISLTIRPPFKQVVNVK